MKHFLMAFLLFSTMNAFAQETRKITLSVTDHSGSYSPTTDKNKVLEFLSSNPKAANLISSQAAALKNSEVEVALKNLEVKFKSVAQLQTNVKSKGSQQSLGFFLFINSRLENIFIHQDYLDDLPATVDFKSKILETIKRVTQTLDAERAAQEKKDALKKKLAEDMKDFSSLGSHPSCEA